MGSIGHAWKVLAGACALALAAHAASGAEQVADKEKVMEKARASYYSLQKAGLAQFKCAMAPNWEMMLRERYKTEPQEAERRAKIFRGIHFEFTAPIGGSPSITHSYSGDEHPELADNFEKIYHGTEQAMSGFYSTWAGFVVTPFLPDATDSYTLEKDHGDYRISSHGGDMEVSAIMGRDMALKSVRMASRDFISTIKPTFGKVEGGYLLSGYEATFKGSAEDSQVKLSVAIDYQVVDGIQLPGKVRIKAVSAEAPFEMEVAFSDCRVTRN